MSVGRLKPYFHNRVSEIKDNIEEVKNICPVEEFYYVPGKLNPADLATRQDGRLADIGPGSGWQCPSFLKQPRSMWSLTREFVRANPPSEEIRSKPCAILCSMNTSSDVAKIWKLVDQICCYSNDWSKVLRIMVRVLRGWKLNISHSTHISETQKQMISEPLTGDEIDRAEKVIMLHAMKDTWQDYMDNKLTSLLPFTENHIIYTKGRVGEAALQRILGIDKLPIISFKSRVAWLLMYRAHTEDTNLDHRGVTATLVKSRTRAWIIQGRRLAKQIRKICPYCRLRSRQLQSQQMSLIKDEQLEPCPPFTHVALDYAGPLTIQGEVNRRATKKVWILVYTCRSTRAVCLLATAGYDTDSFLNRHAEFTYRHGKPKSVVSDRGTQLVKAGLVLSQDGQDDTPNKWSWKKIVDTNHASDWIFTEIGCQWRNGLSESMVKQTKKCLEKAIPADVKITYGELVTLVAGISYTINCRPLGVKASHDLEDEIQPITANQLLLGRSDMDSRRPDYTEDVSLPTRTAYVKNLLDKWWTLWIRQVWPHLIPCKKWQGISRNMEIGDICLLYFPGSLTNMYKLVRICEVHPDKQGLVRTVSIMYRKRDSREKPTVLNKKMMVKEIVGIQRLVLVQPANEQCAVDETPSTSSLSTL